MRATPAPTLSTDYVQMLEMIRYRGAFPTRERAQQAVENVLGALGRRLSGEERVDLAACLPREAARVLAAQIPEPEALTGWEFVKDLAERTGGDLAPTRWEVGSVLGVVARIVGPALLGRVLSRLPNGYALLFGQAELTQAA